jgi:hypothetical protein
MSVPTPCSQIGLFSPARRQSPVASPVTVFFALCYIFIFYLPIRSSAPFKMSIYNMSFISVLAFSLFHFFPANAGSPCYMLNGDLATSDFQPCTSNLPSGSNSACCNMGKNPPDICLGGGLCQRMDSTEGNFVIYAVGCTDRSGKDPACPQYCPSAFLLSQRALFLPL